MWRVPEEGVDCVTTGDRDRVANGVGWLRRRWWGLSDSGQSGDSYWYMRTYRIRLYMFLF